MDNLATQHLTNHVYTTYAHTYELTVRMLCVCKLRYVKLYNDSATIKECGSIMKTCQCNPDCTAEVKGKDKIYAKYHNPNMVWNRGLTKETHTSVAQQSRAITGRQASPETKQKLSTLRKELWSDPIYKAERLAKVLPALHTAETQAKRTAGIKKNWDSLSPEEHLIRIQPLLEHTGEGGTAAWSNPETRERLTNERRTRANTPEERARLTANAKAQWEGESGERMRAERRDRWKTAAYREKMEPIFTKSGTGKAPWNKDQTKDTHPSIKALSEKFKGRIPQRGFRVQYIGPNGTITMRSTWEVVYAHALDHQNVEWCYEPEHFEIGKGVWRGTTYTPDFHLPKTDTWVDVKGYLAEWNKAKFKRFQELFPRHTLEVVCEKDFEAGGISVRELETEIHNLIDQGIDCNGYVKQMVASSSMMFAAAKPKILPDEIKYILHTELLAGLHVGDESEWGTVQAVEYLAKGIYWVSMTEGCGFKLSNYRNAQMRQGWCWAKRGFYEFSTRYPKVNDTYWMVIDRFSKFLENTPRFKQIIASGEYKTHLPATAPTVK